MASPSDFSSSNNHYEETESFLRPTSRTDKIKNSSQTALFETPQKTTDTNVSSNVANNSCRPTPSDRFNLRRPVGPPVPLKPSHLQKPTAPPMAPPPPPPYFYSSFRDRLYDAFGVDESLGSCHTRHKWMLGFAVVEALFGLLILSVGVGCVVEVPEKCPYFTGCWVGGVLILNGCLGVVAAATGKTNLIIAHLVLATVSAVAAIILTVFSAIHWLNTGWGWDFPNYCVWNRFDPEHIKYTYEKMRYYDFKGCVDAFIKELKLGSTFNSLLGSFGVFEVLLCLVSVIFCFHRLCNCGDGYDLED